MVYETLIAVYLEAPWVYIDIILTSNKYYEKIKNMHFFSRSNLWPKKMKLSL